METVFATFGVCVLLVLTASPGGVVKAQGDMMTVQEDMVQIPALSYMDDEGMLAIPTVNLSDVTSVLALQELIGNQSCDCTGSGFSGISLSDDGALTTYGNTTFVGCAAHDQMLRDEGIEQVGEKPALACYVVGGTGCPMATASALQNESEAFMMAAYRTCNPLVDKSFGCFTCPGFGGFSSYFSQTISIQTTSIQTYQPPMCGYCGYQPNVPISTGYCAGGGAAAAAAAAAAGGNAAAAAAAGGNAAATAVAGGGAATASASAFGSSCV